MWLRKSWSKKGTRIKAIEENNNSCFGTKTENCDGNVVQRRMRRESLLNEECLWRGSVILARKRIQSEFLSADVENRTINNNNEEEERISSSHEYIISSEKNVDTFSQMLVEDEIRIFDYFQTGRRRRCSWARTNQRDKSCANPSVFLFRSDP